MTEDRITKLYASLTAKQRAALMFNHSVTGDELEVERIAHSVPLVNYRGRDPEHLSRSPMPCMVAASKRELASLSAIDCHARIGSATPFKELEPRSR